MLDNCRRTIEFDFEGQRYRVSCTAQRVRAMRLSDGRTVVARSWSAGFPAVPSGVMLAPHLKDRTDLPIAVAVQGPYTIPSLEEMGLRQDPKYQGGEAGYREMVNTMNQKLMTPQIPTPMNPYAARAFGVAGLKVVAGRRTVGKAGFLVDLFQETGEGVVGRGLREAGQEAAQRLVRQGVTERAARRAVQNFVQQMASEAAEEVTEEAAERAIREATSAGLGQFYRQMIPGLVRRGAAADSLRRGAAYLFRTVVNKELLKRIAGYGGFVLAIGSVSQMAQMLLENLGGLNSEQLEQMSRSMAADPEWQQHLVETGAVVEGATPEEFYRATRSLLDSWAPRKPEGLLGNIGDIVKWGVIGLGLFLGVKALGVFK